VLDEPERKLPDMAMIRICILVSLTNGEISRRPQLPT
jgi:hypothetical protein